MPLYMVQREQGQGWRGADQAYFQVVDQTIRGALRFAPQVLGPAPLNADELIFAQIFSVPVFTGLKALTLIVVMPAK